MKLLSDVPISPQEAELLFGKSKKAVWWAVQRDQVKARQSVCSQNWMLSLNSCIRAWGEPVMSDLVEEIRRDYADQD